MGVDFNCLLIPNVVLKQTVTGELGSELFAEESIQKISVSCPKFPVTSHYRGANYAYSEY